jgi:hypothetical protein
VISAQVLLSSKFETAEVGGLRPVPDDDLKCEFTIRASGQQFGGLSASPFIVTAWKSDQLRGKLPLAHLAFLIKVPPSGFRQGLSNLVLFGALALRLVSTH